MKREIPKEYQHMKLTKLPRVGPKADQSIDDFIRINHGEEKPGLNNPISQAD